MEDNATSSDFANVAMPIEHSRLDAERTVVCPNCGHRQRASLGDTRCDWCGETFTVNAGHAPGDPFVEQADPADVPVPEVSGGIGRPTDGNQVPLRPSSAVPGKPMAPIADEPVGTDRGSKESGAAQVSEAEKSRESRQ